MAGTTRNDKELAKFGLSDFGDVCMSVDSVTLDPLATAEGSTEDLELSKFNEDGEVRVVLTI